VTVKVPTTSIAIVFCAALVVGGVALYELSYGATNTNTIQSGMTTATTGILTPNGINSTIYSGALDTPPSNSITLGNSPTTPLLSYKAWLMPANVLISTTFNTTRALGGGFRISVNVLPDAATQNSTVYLGLYINGKLAAHTVQDFSSAPIAPAPMVGQPTSVGDSQVANFSTGSATFGVALNHDTSIPAGSVITFTEYANAPTWVQADPTGTFISYETTGTAAITIAPPSLANATPVPVPLDIEGDGNAA
jgi:hypothetical protein